MLGLISWNIQCARTPAGAADLNRIAARLLATWADGGADVILLQETGCRIAARDGSMLPGSECHRRLLAPGPADAPPWQDAWPLAHPQAPRTPHAPTVGLHDTAPDAKPFTFDYFCVSPALAARVRRVRVDPAPSGSDHPPLLLELD